MTITAEAYTTETFMETPVCEYFKYKGMLPSVIARAIMNALQAAQYAKTVIPHDGNS